MTHPALRHPIKQLISLTASPAAWGTQVLLSTILSSHACYPQREPLAAPLWSWLETALSAISALCFFAALAGCIIAWSLWKSFAREAASLTEESRARFLAVTGLWVSGLFFLATIFSACAFLLVAPC